MPKKFRYVGYTTQYSKEGKVYEVIDVKDNCYVAINEIGKIGFWGINSKNVIALEYKSEFIKVVI